METGGGLKLNISENDNSLDIDLALGVLEYFRLEEKTAMNIVEKVKSAVGHWREIATKYGILKADQEVKAPAFKVVTEIGGRTTKPT